MLDLEKWGCSEEIKEVAPFNCTSNLLFIEHLIYDLLTYLLGMSHETKTNHSHFMF